MIRSLDARLRKLEKGRDDEPIELLPGMWTTRSELDEILREVNRRSTGLPSRRRPFDRDGR